MRARPIFEKFDQIIMFQIWLYTLPTLSNFFHSTDLIALIWPCMSGDSWLVDWSNSLRYFLLYLILYDVNFFVKTCTPVNLFVFFASTPCFFYQQRSFLTKSNRHIPLNNAKKLDNKKACKWNVKMLNETGESKHTK